MKPELQKRITDLVGFQREKTMLAACELILQHGWHELVETGCYRGNPADGRSTLIWAIMAGEIKGEFASYDINAEHIKLADDLLCQNNPHGGCAFHHGDSVQLLSSRAACINFAYLDSYDHNPSDPRPCQRHQLAEVGAILGKMFKPCAILMDDIDFPYFGKGGLSIPFLEERGWKCVSEGYQRLYLLE